MRAADIVVLLGASSGIGVLGALVGLGGGVLIVPFLTLVRGVDIRLAAGTSIAAVLATSAGVAAALSKERLVSVRVGLFLSLATTSGALLGSYLSGVVPERLLYLVFAGVMAWSAWLMFRRRNAEAELFHHNPGPDPWSDRLRLGGRYFDPHLGREVAYHPASVWRAFGLMHVAGVISGLLGIGSGALKVLAMDTAMRLPIKVSNSTSNFMIGVTAAASAPLYYLRGDMRPELTAPVVLGVLAGSLVGGRLLVRLSNRTIRLVFVPVLLWISLQMLLRGMGA